MDVVIKRNLLVAKPNTLILILISLSTFFKAQESEIDRLIASEFKMTFPSIYFKHNSTEYASMPYSVDSCINYITSNFDKSINSLVMWRDSAETEGLAFKRIQKIKLILKKQLKTNTLEVFSMGGEQKIARFTINKTSDKTKTNYLLTLNSVFEISKSRINSKVKSNNHVMNPRITCWGCWKNGFHWRTRMKMRKAEKRNAAIN